MKADNRDVQRISNLAKGYDWNLCGRISLSAMERKATPACSKWPFQRNASTISSA